MPTSDIQTFGKRVALEAVRPDEAVQVGVTIGVGFVVAQGDVLGKITSSGLYRRRARTTAAGAGFAVNSAIGHVTDNTVFVAGDVLTDAAGNAIGTVAANGIDLIDLTKVTLTANAANAVAAGTGVICTDGSAVAKGIADQGSDGTVVVQLAAFIAGFLDSAKLRGLDASAMADLSGAVLAGNIFKF